MAQNCKKEHKKKVEMTQLVQDLSPVNAGCSGNVYSASTLIFFYIKIFEPIQYNVVLSTLMD